MLDESGPADVRGEIKTGRLNMRLHLLERSSVGIAEVEDSFNLHAPLDDGDRSLPKFWC